MTLTWGMLRALIWVNIWHWSGGSDNDASALQPSQGVVEDGVVLQKNRGGQSLSRFTFLLDLGDRVRCGCGAAVTGSGSSCRAQPPTLNAEAYLARKVVEMYHKPLKDESHAGIGTTRVYAVDIFGNVLKVRTEYSSLQMSAAEEDLAMQLFFTPGLTFGSIFTQCMLDTSKTDVTRKLNLPVQTR
ncbi:hypothetical protein EDB81DRAFT_762988 [Dactylonectria macrodidyma]|uniref:Uncharacterized protein n=1 Tax=Dactylonectria macrodidyma TaxID=307937 RepID=A0A9P9E8B8_9HYPO|nr:hypothetical protein EDB81DRAFT_762988 [Dactylonectria macrodidyma]